MWLPLARASAEHTPPNSPDTAAERAATHPDSQDALVLTALLVARPTDTWAAHTVLPQPTPCSGTRSGRTATPTRTP
ncbi:hypothetical protein ACIQRC_33110 [Streptomyces californicus]|uniref:hypothetical protein n=1 Tax=Streptomyces californicus TaxID=67351 RepID=UPI00380960BA